MRRTSTATFTLAMLLAALPALAQGGGGTSSAAAQKEAAKQRALQLKEEKKRQEEERKKQEISLMPADIQKLMSAQELVDVVEYMTTLKQAQPVEKAGGN